MRLWAACATALLAVGCSDGDGEGRADAQADVGADAGGGDLAGEAAGDGRDGGDGGDGPGDAADAGADLAPREAPAAAMLEIQPPMHDFGVVATGMTASKTFVVRNEGGVGSGTLDVKLTGDSDAFAIAMSGCDGSLEPASSCMLDVSFTPAAAGAREALLTVMASPGGAVSAQVRGSGGGP
jgi:hypothetical protein